VWMGESEDSGAVPPCDCAGLNAPFSPCVHCTDAPPILDEARIHPAIRDRIAGLHRDIVEEVQAAIATDPVVVVGMRQNPFRARRASCCARPACRSATSSTAATSAAGGGATR